MFCSLTKFTLLDLYLFKDFPSRFNAFCILRTKWCKYIFLLIFYFYQQFFFLSFSTIILSLIFFLQFSIEEKTQESIFLWCRIMASIFQDGNLNSFYKSRENTLELQHLSFISLQYSEHSSYRVPTTHSVFFTQIFLSYILILRKFNKKVQFKNW